MKFLLSFLFFLLLGTEILSAQNVNHKDIRSEAKTYIKVWTSHVFMARGRYVQVDYGQDYYLESSAESFLRDENSEKIRFYSTIQIINYFHDLGFEYLDTCRPMSDDNCWIFKRKE